MELRYLEIFCKVVEFGSFSKAAESLYLTQPTVSIHIKALEDELSTRLLDRLGRKILPTSAGEILYGYAKNIVKLKDEARRALDQFSGRMKGTLAVGASTIPGEYIIPAYLSRFKALYPEVYPALKIADTREIHHSVLEGAVDIGVVGSGIKDRNIVTEKFLDDELVLAAPGDFKKDSVSRKELSELPLILREPGSGSRASLEESLKKNAVRIDDLNVAGEIGSTQAMIQAVKAGMGFSFISRLAVKDSSVTGLLKEVRVLGLRIKRHFYIITHRVRFNSPVSRTFVEFLTGKTAKKD
ncbi:MAG: LysR family transcriptional regulator [Deltaproteobacteria bacterium]|nr:LysR family transcriptional regulator [Deltaproteobacteria bacterium]